MTPQDAALESIAAVDLGSNSFHMVIARIVDGQLLVLDRIKEMVRLAAGLDEDNVLDEAARQRALAALERFGERVRGMEEGSVRAVGTNTLRKAKNAGGFLAAAEQALGHPIEIISGLEEARLVYLGVAYSLQSSTDRRLVMDIGGGSTEFILGTAFEPRRRESKYMGCVSFSQRFFPGGAITDAAMDAAVLAARQELQAMDRTFRQLGWDLAIGASGTIKAVASILDAQGWGRGRITPAGMNKLRKRMVKAGHIHKLKLQGLSDDRAPVFPGGLAILIGAFESLAIDHMIVSDGALREGLMFDLFGRLRREDVRDRTVTTMCERYRVDLEHARRVEATTLGLLAQVAEAWELDDERDATMLGWAARLHEIGLAITHGRYHKHGSYLVENSDMPGFSRQDQQLLWALVRSHRRRFKPHRFDGLPGKLSRTGRRLCILLRLAVLLNRSRHADAVPPLELTARGRTLEVRFPPGWLDAAPLTRADLHDETAYLAAAGWTLEIEG